MAAYKPSTMIDFLNGLPIELDSVFSEPLRRGQSKGVSLPRLSALCAILKSLNDELNGRGK
jgi:2-dehydropantoate 2-reductase